MRERWNQDTVGFLYGFLGVVGFSLTLPVTRLAVESFSPTLVALGRALAAAVLAAASLWIRREKWPSWQQIKSLAIVALGVIVGFPLLSAWAMERLPASHGAVVLALLPLVTAGAAALRAGEYPSRRFWFASVAGSLTVLGYAFSRGLGTLQQADLALLGAVVAAAIGYAEGGKLSRELGGWQVIAWALVLTAPFLVWPVAASVTPDVRTAPPIAWVSFAYLSLGSQFAAFVAWYTRLGIGGVARVSQLQYLQPFLTILWAAWLLGEAITPVTIVACLIVVIVVALARNAAVARKPLGKFNTKS